MLLSAGVLALRPRCSPRFRSWLLHLEFSQQGEWIWNVNPALSSLYYTEELSLCKELKHTQISVSWVLYCVSSCWLLFLGDASVCCKLTNIFYLYSNLHVLKSWERFDKPQLDKSACLSEYYCKSFCIIMRKRTQMFCSEMELQHMLCLLNPSCCSIIPVMFQQIRSRLCFWFCPNPIHVLLMYAFNDLENKNKTAAETFYYPASGDKNSKKREKRERNLIIPVFKNWFCF